MRLCPFSTLAALPLLLLNVAHVAAERVITSAALETCQKNSSFTASLFDIVFTPNNRSLALNVVGDSSIDGNVTLVVHAAAYGYNFLTRTVDPCELNMGQLCPLQDIQIEFDTIYQNLSTSIIGSIPSVAYGIPDLDATVTVYVSPEDDPNNTVACVRSRLSNGQTVDQNGVSWATAIVAGLGLVTSALISGLGHSNAASHIALYALSLFTYFQDVAIVGFCAVPLPPIVQSWTQDFSWSMGIIRVNFLQKLATWYQIATGGTPTTLLQTLDTISVQVLKRGLELQRRAQTPVAGGEYTVKGIQRVAFRSHMESTNLFLTGVIFFFIFIIFTVIGVIIFKYSCELAIKNKWMKSDRFQTLRDGLRVTLKGIILRILLIGYPQMAILCLWEFTQHDSPAEVVLAVIIFFGMTIALGLASFKVIQIARRSQQIHQTPAYMLYADATALNKWGFLYVQFRATAYYYIIPTLIYILIKAMFIAFGQNSGTTQAIALVLIEAAALIGACVLRPWMDKPANGINIGICVINFLNAIFLLIFTGVFNGPGLLIGVTGVIFFVVNAAFSLVLLIIVLVAVIYPFMAKNPDTRYQPISDNRASFIKSQTALTTELDTLGAAARGVGDFKGNYKDRLDLDDDSDHHNSDLGPHQQDPALSATREPPRSPISPSMPYLPAGSDVSSMRTSNTAHTGPPAQARSVSPFSETASRHTAHTDRAPPEYRSQNNVSPWQRGAGYEH
ncbi:hypothetical protein F5884DRAFT_851098 [Xylogone sp. PMI_703]|nr:hypothetical protein F5884DRAFT_851098 [Xylogone sp. PMI_703]